MLSVEQSDFYIIFTEFLICLSHTNLMQFIISNILACLQLYNVQFSSHLWNTDRVMSKRFGNLKILSPCFKPLLYLQINDALKTESCSIMSGSGIQSRLEPEDLSVLKGWYDDSKSLMYCGGKLFRNLSINRSILKCYLWATCIFFLL